MGDQLISFETAKLAKEKGFILGIGWHGIDGKFYHNGQLTDNHRGDNPCAPTQSLLQKWLRERKSPIVLEVNFGVIDDSESAFTWHISEYVPEGVEGTRKKDEMDFWKNYDSFVCVSGAWYETYEEALEEGLIETLNLI